MISRRSTLIGLLVLSAVLVTGCGEHVAGKPSGTAAQPTSASATTPAPVPTTAGPPTEHPQTHTPTRKPTPHPAVPRTCTVADLRIVLGTGEGTAGRFYRALAFINTGRSTCVIQGFPGVSFVAGDDGHQVGEPAIRQGIKGQAIRLTPGSTAMVALGFADIGAYDPAQCEPTAVRGLRVYPPHDTRSAFVSYPTTACAGSPPSPHLTVTTVQRVTS